MDWLFGRRSQQPSNNPPPAPPPPVSAAPVREPIYEAPDIDTLLTPHDPSRLHPLANLDKQTLDYIILEDEQIKSVGAVPSRGWTDDLCYGTGATYLTGTPHFSSFQARTNRWCVALGMGGAWGVIEALRQPRQNFQAHNILNPTSGTTGGRIRVAAGSPNLAAAASAASTASQATRQSGKLILNNILNHVTRRGPYLGNSAGVLAMMYNLLNASLESWTPVPANAIPLVSGFIAGALFRSTKGPRAMTIAGTLVMGVAAGWQGIKRSIT